MKLKKLMKILPDWERIRVWGSDENTPIFDGYVEDIPIRLKDRKLIKGPDATILDIRYNCADIEDHVAVFIED